MAAGFAKGYSTLEGSYLGRAMTGIELHSEHAGEQ
jgi:hypothetical protein